MSEAVKALREMFPSIPDGCAGGSLRAWYFYLSEISLWRLEQQTKKRIIDCLTVASSLPVEALSLIAEDVLGQIQAWQDTLVPSIDITKPDDDPEVGDVLKFVLRGRITYLHEIITWPFLRAFIDNEGLIPATSLVHEWTKKAASFHHQRILVNHPGFFHRHHGTWFMIRSSARSALILLAIARLPSAVALLPPDQPRSIF